LKTAAFGFTIDEWFSETLNKKEKKEPREEKRRETPRGSSETQTRVS